MKTITAALLIMLGTNGFAQTDSTRPSLSFSGYIEAYYGYDFGNPADHNRPPFVYSYNRHNEVSLHLGLVKAAYKTATTRANLGLMAGSYANANLSAEPGVLKNIYEANAGVKISKTKALWIDAGIFSSHIGFESAIGKDCWNLTRSLLADNSPYFETGVKIAYTTANGKWLISGLVLNGWQRMQRIAGNNTPAFGHQLVFKPTENITLNSSSIIGNDKPDSIRQMRYFHNCFGQFQVTEKLGFIAGFDIGFEQTAKNSGEYNTWYAPVLIAKYSCAGKHNLAARVEYYSDEAAVLIETTTPKGFKTWGYSVNYDHLIGEHVLWRIEGRCLSANDKVFLKGSNPANSNFLLITSLSVAF